MTLYVQIKCTRCQCVQTTEQNSPEFIAINRDGFGLTVGREKYAGCGCYCHGASNEKIPPRLVSRIIEIDDNGEIIPF